MAAELAGRFPRRSRPAVPELGPTPGATSLGPSSALGDAAGGGPRVAWLCDSRLAVRWWARADPRRDGPGAVFGPGRRGGGRAAGGVALRQPSCGKRSGPGDVGGERSCAIPRQRAGWAGDARGGFRAPLRLSPSCGKTPRDQEVWGGRGAVRYLGSERGGRGTRGAVSARLFACRRLAVAYTLRRFLGRGHVRKSHFSVVERGAQASALWSSQPVVLAMRPSGRCAVPLLGSISLPKGPP